MKYECSGKKQGHECSGRRIYVREKIEIPVMEQIKAYLAQIKSNDFSDELEKRKLENAKKLQKKVDGLKVKRVNMEKEITALEDEIPNALMGNSPFKPEQLATLVNEKQEELKSKDAEIRAIEAEIMSVKVEASDISAIREALPTWEKIFENANDDRKKCCWRDVNTFPDKILSNKFFLLTLKRFSVFTR